MTRRWWRRKADEADAAVRVAEGLRDTAQRQQAQAEAMTPRVDAVASSLRLRLGRVTADTLLHSDH